MGVLPSQVGNLPSVPEPTEPGGFPPIANSGNTITNPTNAVAGCSYVQDCGNPGCNFPLLNLPDPPNDGDEVGFAISGRNGVSGGAATGIWLDAGTKWMALHDCHTIVQSLQVYTPGARVLRWNASTNVWVTVMGSFKAEYAFPPIDNKGDWGTGTIPATAGCSYIYTCASCGNGTLQLPGAPADGNEVGFYRIAGAATGQVSGQTKNILRTSCSGLSTQHTLPSQPVVVRWSSTRNLWETVLGGW